MGCLIVIKLNMMSSADKIKGQGVGSAYLELIELVKTCLSDKINMTINSYSSADIVHYHTIDPIFYLKVIFTSKKTVKVGSVHFVPETVEQSIVLPKLFKKIFYAYIISFYKKMDYLVVVNPFFIKVLENYKIPKDKIRYIPNYVSDKNFFKISEYEKKIIKKEFKINEEKFIVLAAGQLQTRKGIFDYIELAEKMPNVEFIWAGGFSFKNISDGYSKIKDIVKNPPKNLHFLGIIEREKMNGLYNISNVMLLPSFEELFPMVILESMNCEVPIILRDLEIYNDILFDFYIKSTDVKGFEELIVKLMKDNDFRNAASVASKRGKEFYSKENVSNLWSEFYSYIYENSNKPKTTTRL